MVSEPQTDPISDDLVTSLLLVSYMDRSFLIPYISPWIYGRLRTLQLEVLHGLWNLFPKLSWMSHILVSIQETAVFIKRGQLVSLNTQYSWKHCSLHYWNHVQGAIIFQQYDVTNWSIFSACKGHCSKLWVPDTCRTATTSSTARFKPKFKHLPGLKANTIHTAPPPIWPRGCAHANAISTSKLSAHTVTECHYYTAWQEAERQEVGNRVVHSMVSFLGPGLPNTQ